MMFFPLLAIAVLISASMAIAWVVQRKTGASGWIDAIWTFSVGIFAASAAMLAGAGDDSRRYVIVALVLFWSVRLGLHIASRTIKGGDDPRYADLARQWGDSFARQLFVFLQIQALAGFGLVVSVFAAASNESPFGRIADIAGLFIAALAIVGEAISDHQLRNFRKRGGGQICEVGLWAYS